MRIASSFLMTVALGSVLVACGGDDGDGGGNPDASRPIDAAPMIDAPAGLVGLGQKCGQGLPACPANASACIGFQGTNSYCTPLCVTDGTATTNAQGQITATTPPPDNSICTGAFTGTVGTAACGVIIETNPMDNPLMPNKAYTGIDVGCAVRCGAGNTCPTGMTCNAQAMICLPN